MSRPTFLIGLCLLVGMAVACSGPPQARESAPEASSLGSQSTVVARYADEVITLTELDSAFAASVGGRANAADSSLRAYRRFLKRYVNYRLKVRAARDAGMDTLASIRRDVQRYRQKLARPRLLRQNVYEPVVRTLYERRNQTVDVSHILIRPASDRDTLDAYRTIQKIADSLDRGVSFAALAYRNSDDPAARKKGRRGYKGRLGYLRAGQIVPAFEDHMYSVNPGEVSEVFRTKYGYHILKVHDRRPARPPVRLSHILRRPQGDTAETRRLLDSLRTELRRGSLSFAAAAKRYSQDPRSAAKGGDLGTIRPQALPAALREAVTALDSVGAVSGVVRSRFGYHLLKLTGRQERKSFDEAYQSLKKNVTGQPRVERRKTSLAHRVRSEHGSTVDTTRLLRMADTDSLEALARPLLALTDSSAGRSPVVARLGDSTYTALQMARHLMQTDGGAQMTIDGLIESFLNEKALQYAATRLAQQTPSLRRKLNKYREGALLFRYMQDSIWTVAAQDSAGLRATYRKHGDRYRFPARVRTIALRAPTDSLLRPYHTAYERGRSLTATVKAAAGDSLVSADTIYVTEQSAEVYHPVLSADDGAAVGPTAHNDEWLLLVRDTRLPARPKTFEEARSSVVQDYQETYEQRILEQLRDRYDVETYPERLRPPFRDMPQSP